MQKQLTEAARMHQINAPTTRDKYLTKAQTWANLMSRITPQDMLGTAPTKGSSTAIT